jgi:lysine 2,3-aminomutase
MELWQELVRKSVASVDELVHIFGLNVDTAKQMDSLFHTRINPYYLGLIRYPGDPIWLQCTPNLKELEDDGLPEDPLNEDGDSPVPNITHRYPDRVLFLVTSQCSMYCRFCTRKRKVGDSSKISMKWLEAGIDYITKHKEIRDVVISGGDPLMLTDYMLEKILSSLRAIPHVEIIRIGTRIPSVLPQRVTSKLCNMLKKFHPIYINTHFNHPWECTSEAQKACEMLSDAGIPIGNQSVLLKGVNDSADVMLELVRKLLKMRVKPYYLYQADITKGANYFRTSIQTGLEIMDKLRGHTSGLAVPYYVIDAPGGGGKIPLLPNYVLYRDEEKIVLRNYGYDVFEYPEAQAEKKRARKSKEFLRRKRRIYPVKIYSRDKDLEQKN